MASSTNSSYYKYILVHIISKYCVQVTLFVLRSFVCDNISNTIITVYYLACIVSSTINNVHQVISPISYFFIINSLSDSTRPSWPLTPWPLTCDPCVQPPRDLCDSDQ